MQTALTFRTNRDLFSNYYLDKHLPETEEWDEVSDEELQQAYDEIQELWDREKSTAPKRNESQLEEKFIRPMFRKLGIPFEVEESTDRTQRRPDYGFFETEDAARNAFERREEGGDFYNNATAVADAKRWGRPLDTRGSGEHERDFENPSYQIHVYLQETPARWAVLTNGKKWRLYYAPTSHRLDSYYEVDLPTVLENGDLEEFKYFYLFFRHQAFVEDAGGDSFLDDVYDESNVFAQELGEDLQDNIYEAIKVLSEGFLQYPDNDLDGEDLDRIHDSSLIYLYRLIFVLYAEAEGRELLDTSNDIYEQSYSLNSLKQEVAEELDSGDPKYRDWQDNLWSRLDELFKLIDKGSKSRGIPEDDLYIPAYNGGLFRTDPDDDDSREARFLANHEVGDAYLARVIELLTRSQNGNGKIFVDYSSLDVRHLGSVYEGLLEYKLNIADEPLGLDDGEYVSADEADKVVVDESEVYLTTDSGERKATGSYYTPEYVVEHIVENTLEPLVSDIREDLLAQSARGDRGFAEDFAERVFELKILDPAMGSGHFLTSAVDYLAREIIDAQEKQAAQQGIETVDESHDINWARRQVAQRCIYGVDLNPLAVELAKVSLWLRTLAAEQPLAFLDHHLKTGNSLVGSDIEDVLDQEGDTVEEGQLTLTQSFEHTRQQALEHVLERFTDLLSIDNETLEDVKRMEDVYDEVREDNLYQHLLAMANVHTADEFGLAIPDDAYERMAEALRDDSWESILQQSWFKRAQEVAEEEQFFHWELEFPVAFYGEDGEIRDNAGFDAVIGNPPYVFITSIPQEYRDYFDEISSTYDYRFDLYAIFIEQGLDLTVDGGGLSYIIPHNLLNNNSFELVREKLVTDSSYLRVIDFTDDVFEDATNEPMIVYSEVDRAGDSVSMLEGAQIHPSDLVGVDQHLSEYPAGVVDYLPGRPLLIRPAGWVTDYVDIERSQPLSDFVDAQQGLRTGDNDRFLTEDPENEDEYRKIYRGSDLHRYGATWGGDYVHYDRDQLDAPRDEKYWEADGKLIAQAIRNSRYPRRIVATYDDEQYIGFNSTINFVTHDETDVSIFYIMAILSADLTNHYFWTCFIDNNLATQYFNSIPVPVVDFEKEQPDNNEISDFEEKVDDFIEETNSDAIEFIESNISPDTVDRPVAHEILDYLARRHTEVVASKDRLNTNLMDYISPTSADKKVSECGIIQPARGVQQTKLAGSPAEHEGLRIADVRTERNSDCVSVWIKPKYKPEDADSVDTTRHGYVDGDFIKAFELIDLDEQTAVLLAEFIPEAVNNLASEVNFYKKATKTISLIDRVKNIQIPDISNIDSGFQTYVELKNREREYDEAAEKLDELTDRAVEELYGNPTADLEDGYPL
ncbi:Eco57I restriction-modification methylase domain-containing protein [Haloparvum sp. AD34]